MKKYLISIISVVVLVAAWQVFGQRQDRTRQRAERREALRKKWESMSEQERQRLTASMSERFGARWTRQWRQQQLKAIGAIEEQLAKLKKAVEGITVQGEQSFSEMSPQERAELREKWSKARQERQKAVEAIEKQLATLRGQRVRRPPAPEGLINELKAIQGLAVKEKADETARRLERLLRRYPRPLIYRPLEPGEKPRIYERPRRERPKREQKVEQLRRKAPEFTLKSFDGKTVSLSDYKGKIVVLEWFNFECPFVRFHYDKANTMIDLAKKYKDKNVVWLAINSTSHTTPQANKAFAQKHNLPYLILDDRPGKVGHAYGAKTTPHMFIIDPQGNIAYEGAIDNSPLGREKDVINYVDKALSELTSGKAVTTPNTKPYGCSVKYPK